MPGPVSFETMVTFVRQEIGDLTRSIDGLVRRLDTHDAWHRGLLEEQLRTKRTNGWSTWQIVFQALIAVVAVVSLILTAVHLH